jgi:DNA polymerase-3 subunit beta
MTNETTSITVSADMLRAALICASKEQARYYLNGVYVDAAGYLVATDGHRLFAGKFTLPDDAAPFDGWIIPSDVIKRALTGYKNKTITISPNRCGDISCQPIDGTYPAWRRVLPQGDLSGVAAQFNPAYIADLGKMGKLLGASGALPAHVHHNGESPAGITFPNCPNAFAVLMPIRSAHAAPDSAWKDATAI